MSKQYEFRNTVSERCPYDAVLERIPDVKSEPVYDNEGNYRCHIFPVRPAKHGFCYYHKCVVVDKTITCWQHIHNYEERYGKSFYRS